MQFLTHNKKSNPLLSNIVTNQIVLLYMALTSPIVVHSISYTGNLRSLIDSDTLKKLIDCTRLTFF